MGAAQSTLSALRRNFAVLEQGFKAGPWEPFSFGEPDVDGFLRGGLARGALHEVYAGGETDAVPATAFAAALALRAAEGRTFVWVRQDRLDTETGRLHAPGLAELGLDPRAVLLVQARDAAGVLRAGAEAVRCPALGGVLIEPWGEPKALDLTASRRLSLAAAASGVTTFMVRVAARPIPSAAATRWAVGAGASVPLEGGAPGHPVFDLALLRHRGGLPTHRWRLEWDRDRRCFQNGFLRGRRVLRAVPTLPRPLAAVPADRAPAPACAADGLQRFA